MFNSSKYRNFGLRNVHDPKYDEFKRLEIDEKTLPKVLPPIVSYKYEYPAVDNQGGLGTCVAYGTRKIFEFYFFKRHGIARLVSPRAIYAQAKSQFESGDVQDDGLNVSDGLNTVKEYYVWESDYPSVPNDSEANFPAYLQVAPENLHRTDFIIKNFVTVDNHVDAMKKALYKNGPFLIGTAWPNSWMDVPPSGILPAPDVQAGGHCVGIVGYNDNVINADNSLGAFELINNWTTEWANEGYAWLPYSLENTQFFPTDIFTVQA